ncbi:MAG: MBL fold metallo-hydrolase RNA specificity domain-containing protein, partial [Acidimicrobiales bacterium]
SAVSRVIDGLHRRGAEVVHSGLADVHVSGHAMRRELQILQNVARPQWFVPVHGEYRHLHHHARLAQDMGLDPDRILLCEDGDVITISDSGIDFSGEVPAGYLYVDGIVGDVGHGVLRDRRVLAEEGVIVVIVGIDVSSGEILTGPEVITRGWVHATEAEPLLDEARAVVRTAVAETFRDGAADDPEAVKRRVRSAIGRLVQERTRRRPMIVPVVMEA